MELRYANPDDVLSELVVDSDDVIDAHVVSQVERMEAALAAAFDQRIGRSFGDTATPSTRSIAVGSGHSVAILSSPAREVVGVAHGGRYDGITWEGEVVEDIWIPRLDGKGHVYGIERNGGTWPAMIRVSAVWASDPIATVPEDVSHCLTWLTIRQYRRMTSSPNELVGPEGFTVPTPHAWDDPMVKEIIEKYRVVEVIV